MTAPARAQSTAPTVAAVVDAATYTTALGADSLASIFGANLVNAGKVSASGACIPPAGTGPFAFPTTECGVTVQAQGDNLPLTSLPLIYVGKQAGYDQINFQLPNVTGAIGLTVNTDGTPSNTTSLTLLSAAPSVYAWGNHFAAAQNAAYGLVQPSNPLVIPSAAPGLSSYAALYVQGLPLQDPATAPAPGTGYPMDRLVYAQPVTVLINGTALPPANVLFAGGSPGLVIQQVNITPDSSVSSGMNSVQVCTGGGSAQVCSPTVTVPMTNAPDFAYGMITDPGTMSDGMVRNLSGIVANAGATSSPVDSFGNYLVPASGTINLQLAGNGLYENWNNTITVSGPTSMPTIMAFPHVVYTDVTGTYDRTTGTWDLTTGHPTAFDMLHYMNVSHDQQWGQIIHTWLRADRPIKAYIAPPTAYYSATTGALDPNGTIGQDTAVWGQLDTFNQTIGQQIYQRVNYDPVVAGDHGLSVYFEDPGGNLGGTTGYPNRDNTVSGEPIQQAFVEIAPEWGWLNALQGVARHEGIGRAIGYGLGATCSPFSSDNMNMYGNVTDSPRDKDGRAMIVNLPDKTDLSKYGY